MLQIQLCFIYGWSVVTKLLDPGWRSGDAMFFIASRTWDWYVPQAWIMSSPWLYKPLTFSTMVGELGFALLVWNRRIRPYAIASMVMLHLGILFTMGIVHFSWYMLAFQLVFLERRSWLRGTPAH